MNLEIERVDSMQPFAPGDVFVGCTWLNNPDDDHAGYGRILQYDNNLNFKGVLWNKDTDRFVVGLHFAPDGILWGFDPHDHKVIQIGKDGKQLQTHHFNDRSFGSINFTQNGDFYFGEYFIGNKIHPHTDCKKIPGTDLLGHGNIHHYSKDLEFIEEFEVDNCVELTGFKGVTHSTLHPSEEYISYTTETGKRVMRYNLLDKKQMPDLIEIKEGNIYDQNWFVTPHYLKDGTLLVSKGRSLDVYDESGNLLDNISIGEYGYAQITTDETDRFCFACNVWTGDVSKIDLHTRKVIRTIQIDNSELALEWQRQQNAPGYKGPRAPRRAAAGIAVY